MHSRHAALAGIAVLAILVAMPPEPARLLAAAPLIALLPFGFAPLRYWPIAVASLMLPYFAWGVMRIVTEPAARIGAVAFATFAIGVFLAALDSMRRP